MSPARPPAPKETVPRDVAPSEVTSAVPRIFAPDRRRVRRDRAHRIAPDGGALVARMAEELAERLAAVSRPFTRALIVGPVGLHRDLLLGGRDCSVTLASPGAAETASMGGQQRDELAPPVGPASQDLIIAGGTLDTIDDLPGALAAMRRALRPDGLMLCCLVGSPSLPVLRRLVAKAEAPRAVARFHPLVELRQLGDLLGRAGFALPVVDSDRIDIAYRALPTLITDIRAAGAANLLHGAVPALGRPALARLIAGWEAARAADGRVHERVTLLHGSGWSPDPSQPKPARPGSATASLTAALTGQKR